MSGEAQPSPRTCLPPQPPARAHLWAAVLASSTPPPCIQLRTAFMPPSGSSFKLLPLLWMLSWIPNIKKKQPRGSAPALTLLWPFPRLVCTCSPFKSSPDSGAGVRFVAAAVCASLREEKKKNQANNSCPLEVVLEKKRCYHSGRVGSKMPQNYSNLNLQRDSGVKKLARRRFLFFKKKSLLALEAPQIEAVKEKRRDQLSARSDVITGSYFFLRLSARRALLSVSPELRDVAGVCGVRSSPASCG